MNAVLYPLCASVAWISLLFKLPALLSRARGPAATAIGFFYLFMGLTFTISDPRVWALLDRLTGVPNLALLLSQSSVIGVAASQLAALTHWALPSDEARPRVRRQLWVFACVLVAMAALFALADLKEEDTTSAAVRYAGQGLYSVYLMLYVTAFAVTQVLLAQQCLRYARGIEGKWLSRGLRLAALGAVGGMVYSAVRYADVVARPLGMDPQRWEFLARLGAGLGGILTLIGWSIPGWGPQINALRRWWRHHLAHRDLYPLWAALRTANPELALDRMEGRRAFRDLDFRLHRRVVEIQDGRRWLRPYQDPGVVEAATGEAASAGLTGDDLRAHVEAATIASALATRARVGAAAPPAPPAPATQDPGPETDWLVRVSRAFATMEPR